MKKILSLSLLAILFLASCGQSEYAYNEAAAVNYYEMSKQFEESYKEFSEGKYKTRLEYNNDEFVNYNPSAMAAKYLKGNAAYAKERANSLKPSSKAQAFHNKTNEYFDLVGGPFANTLQAFADLNCDCPAQKDSLSTQLHNLYERISGVEDQCLEEQKKYLESVGLHAK